jgi:uncharacterized protein YggE
MVKSVVLALLLGLLPHLLMAQVAGNAIQSQKKSPRYYENNAANDIRYAQTANFSNSLDFAGDTAITLNAKVLMNVLADSYVVLLGTAQIGENVEACHALMDKRINGFLDALQKAGIPSKNCYIDFVSQVPAFEYEVEKKLFSTTYNEVPNGFEIKKNVHVAYNDHKMLNLILTEAAKYEIYDIIKVDVVVDNIEAINDSLRHKAVQLLHKKASDYRKLGIKFDATRYQTIAEKIGSVYPVEQYDSYTAFVNPSLSSVKKGGYHVENAPKSQTIYYNKLPYNEFDAVINPQVIEPVAQFYCHIQTRYVLKP